VAPGSPGLAAFARCHKSKIGALLRLGDLGLAGQHGQDPDDVIAEFRQVTPGASRISIFSCNQ
jgi:hypothetical protein